MCIRDREEASQEASGNAQKDSASESGSDGAGTGGKAEKSGSGAGTAGTASENAATAGNTDGSGNNGNQDGNSQTNGSQQAARTAGSASSANFTSDSKIDVYKRQGYIRAKQIIKLINSVAVVVDYIRN